jgi:hypothetical protein
MFLASLGKTNVSSISSVQGIQYKENTMKVFKASGICSSLWIPYKMINIQENMRVTGAFTMPITDQQSRAIPKEVYTFLFLIGHLTFLCKIESSIESDIDIVANQHSILIKTP